MSTGIDDGPTVSDAQLVISKLVTSRVPSAHPPERLTVVGIEGAPGGACRPLHGHPPDEVFHVVKGHVTALNGNTEPAQSTTLTAGETDHVPGGIPPALKPH
jgi:quercetin dioxygenase-like cupin family protein